MAFDYASWLRPELMPHIWCPGCGIGIVLKSVIRSMDSMGWNQDTVGFVSGIGCTSRAPGYVDMNTLHTTHGRALTFATGLKMAAPDKNVVVMAGDGDSAAIGGNHLIHSCRRNIDITMVIVNNEIYGMTGGQFFSYDADRRPGSDRTVREYRSWFRFVQARDCRRSDLCGARSRGQCHLP